MKQRRIQKDRRTAASRRQEDEQAPGDPDVHEDARKARRRAYRASGRAAGFLRRTERET